MTDIYQIEMMQGDRPCSDEDTVRQLIESVGGTFDGEVDAACGLWLVELPEAMAFELETTGDVVRVIDGLTLRAEMDR